MMQKCLVIYGLLGLYAVLKTVLHARSQAHTRMHASLNPHANSPGIV